ncbi:MAG: hypothetical protein KGO94_08385 [Alphaproteobacteria bacterium]|nr:hypothetical protein [Alphaproteobacteria bacterium]
MSGQQLDRPESLDDILNIVKETPRGRWFIEAYTDRVRASDTTTILAAIAKLENSLQSMSGSGADAALLQKARMHIAQARADIAASETGKATLSPEGQLFAKLADVSRRAFTEGGAGQPVITKNIERALRLVVDLDQDLGTSLVPMPAGEATPPGHYFKQDENVFEPAPQPVAAVAAVAAVSTVSKHARNVETTPRGAKLVIQHVQLVKPEAKITETELPAPAPHAAPEAKDEPLAIQSDQGPASAESVPEPSRIVIIRRKAEDVMEMPLVEENKAEAETAA